MSSRIRREALVFRHPFRLHGWTERQPAGTYAMETEEALIEGLSFPAYHRIATTLTRDSTAGGACRQVLPVDPRELEALLAADRAAPGDAP